MIADIRPMSLPESNLAVPAEALSRWTSIVLRASSERLDPLTRLYQMADDLRIELRAAAGFMTLSKISGGPETLVMQRMAGFGEWAPSDRAARDAYHADVNRYPDPFVWEYILRGRHKMRSAVLRQECVSDSDWYSSPHYQLIRKKARQDSCFYVTMPACDPRGVQLEPGLIWTINFNRSTGDPQFTPDERDFAAYCFFGLEPLLFEVWKNPAAPQEVLLDALPIRLRRVADCLVAGDTIKQAAVRLGLSVHTVQGYVKDLYRQCDVASRAELLIKLLPNPVASGPRPRD